LKADTLKLFLFLCFAILVTSCESQQEIPEQAPATEARPATEKQLTLTEEAEDLIARAESSESTTEQRNYRIQAANKFIDAGDIQRAREQLAVIKEQFKQGEVPDAKQAGIARASILLLATKIAIAEQDTQTASDLLANVRPVTREQQIEFYTRKADIDSLSGNYMYAVDRRVQLDKYIEDENEKNLNNEKIWAALSNLTTRQLREQQSTDPVIQGWLDLANVMRSGQQNIGQLENDLLDWGTRHPLHPVSNSFLAKLISDYQVDLSTHKQIAVLLPLHGDLSVVADSIKNGLLASWYSDADNTVKPVIRFYDSNTADTDFEQLYQRVIDDGATTIIGPLDKSEIDQLAQRSALQIPVLTLNYAENEFTFTDNLYQFGLSPTDEARQVAELAIRQNKKHAAVFYPDSDWGKRLNKAFTEKYESLGGKILATRDYAPDTNDYKRPITELLNLNQSSIRRTRVENTIGEKTVSEPYRRHDIDMIFLVATHQSARGIIPAFKFNHAGDIPVYSTSHVYTGKINRELDRDLNGLIFCDMPWILQNNSDMLATFRQNWPQLENYTRLFALGIDAYHLIYNLDYLKNRDYAYYAGQTGNIQLNDYNRITRKLLWAQFQNGKPVYFEPLYTTQEKELATN
jgi:outer membrane PBP1 activator LpoA protein